MGPAASPSAPGAPAARAARRRPGGRPDRARCRGGPDPSRRAPVHGPCGGRRSAPGDLPGAHGARGPRRGAGAFPSLRQDGGRGPAAGPRPADRAERRVSALNQVARPLTRPSTRERLADFLELTKPRVTSLVLVTTFVGFYLSSQGAIDMALLLNTLLGTALVAAGTSALNQYVEREEDGLMLRTRRRPLPAGRMDPAHALAFAATISVAGLLHLLLTVNLMTAGLAALTLLSYVFWYTPLKRITTLCTVVGAIPGALPPLGGWTAAHGDVAAGGVALFAILFVWQLPHSLAIAMLYKDDYARGGFRLLPVVDEAGGATGRQILAHCLVLLP